MSYCGKVDHLNAILFRAPAPFARFELSARSSIVANSEISGENRHVMASLGQTSRERADFYHRSALFLERVVGLNHL